MFVEFCELASPYERRECFYSQKGDCFRVPSYIFEKIVNKPSAKITCRIIVAPKKGAIFNASLSSNENAHLT